MFKYNNIIHPQEYDSPYNPFLDLFFPRCLTFSGVSFSLVIRHAFSLGRLRIHRLLKTKHQITGHATACISSPNHITLQDHRIEQETNGLVLGKQLQPKIRGHDNKQNYLSASVFDNGLQYFHFMDRPVIFVSLNTSKALDNIHSSAYPPKNCVLSIK